MPVPFGTCTVRSSIVTLTSSGALTSHSRNGGSPYEESATRSRGYLGDGRVRVHRHRREDVVQRGRVAERAAALLDVRDELLAELRDVARDGHRGRLAERAEALAVDAVAYVEQQVELTLRRAALLQLAQDRRHPARALA